ncbi:DUF4307 domain-containing protein [Nocardiopsis algeriensis]|uniref:DUF4307 domain-containing protein n=1 Tax=Nocardiopsis algeriensis TaxID=1478215 RepID=UPI003B43ACE4
MPTNPEEDAVSSADTPAADASEATEQNTEGPTAPALRRKHGNGPVFFVIASLFAGVCAVGWGAAVMNYSGFGSSVHHQLLTSSVTSDTEASLTFEVNSKGDAVCLVRASDSQFVEVGQADVAIEPGNHVYSTTFETTRRAATVEVVSCREQDPQD